MNTDTEILEKTHAVFTGTEFHDWLCIDRNRPLDGVRPFYRADGILEGEALTKFLAGKMSHHIPRLTPGQWLVIDCCEARIIYEKSPDPDEAIAHLTRILKDEQDGTAPYQFDDELKQTLAYVLEQLTDGKINEVSLKVAGQWLTQAVTQSVALAKAIAESTTEETEG